MSSRSHSNSSQFIIMWMIMTMLTCNILKSNMVINNFVYLNHKPIMYQGRALLLIIMWMIMTMITCNTS